MYELHVVVALYTDRYFIFHPESNKWWKAKFSTKSVCVNCVNALLQSWYTNEKEKDLDLKVNFVDSRDETHLFE